jgi:OOP family OmpA-OmpF porin
MKWINSPRVLAATLCFFGAANSWAESVLNQLNRTLDGAHEYAARQTDFTRYELVLGALNYQYPSSPDEIEGFRAEKSRTFEGEIDRRVLDLQAGVGSLKAFSVIKEVLREEGFGIQFSCEGYSCGSIKGWSVFYPDQLDGSQSDQFFVSAIYPRDAPPERAFSAHISMVGGRVRVTLDEVTLLVELERSIDNYADAILAYWSENGFNQGISISGYGLGSFRLTDTMKLKYRAISRIIERNPDLPVQLLGYTDILGEKRFNQELSFNRAKVGAEFLATMGISENALHFEGRGVFTDVDDPRPQSAAPQHRKVMVFVNPLREFSSLD